MPGIDLLSIGVVDADGSESRTVAVSAYGTRRYRKLVLEDGRLTGAIILGSPELFDDVTTAVERSSISAPISTRSSRANGRPCPGSSRVRQSRLGIGDEGGPAWPST